MRRTQLSDETRNVFQQPAKSGSGSLVSVPPFLNGSGALVFLLENITSHMCPEKGVESLMVVAGEKASQGDAVWFADICTNSKIIFGFETDLSLDGNRRADAEIFSRFNQGVLEREQMPDRLSLGQGRAARISSLLPDIFVAGDFLTVSSRVAEVLGGFELGQSVIKPVELLNEDRKTPISTGWNLFQVKEWKTGFDAGLSSNLPKSVLESAQSGPPSLTPISESIDAVMNASALQGADVWMDPGVQNSLFLSNKLYDALLGADLLGPLQVMRCRVVSD